MKKNFNIFCRGMSCLILFLTLSTLSGCEKFIESKAPSMQINGLNVFNQEATSIAAVTEIYGILAHSLPYSIYPSLSSDELKLADGVTETSYVLTYKNELQGNNTENMGFPMWSAFYRHILSANASLEGLLASTKLTDALKNQLLGECYFMRAFSYFYLTNYYGDVALALTSDPNLNSKLSRTPQTKVYEQIVADLLRARDLLSSSYMDQSIKPYSGNPERVRPNKYAAIALLARVYLYMGPNHYADAENAASQVIDNTNLYSLMPINEVFLKNSRETIWALQGVKFGRNTDEGFLYILPPSGPSLSENPVYLSDMILNSFETGDKRAIMGNWINKVITPTGSTYYFPFKYKSNTAASTEYNVVLRVSEQYLIRSEARALQGKLTGANSAASDLNTVRERAGLTAISPATSVEFSNAILKERQSELFTEWGHRWFDLKRTGKVDEVMTNATVEKGSSWQSYQQLYPIPILDIQRGPNLKQNPGY